MKSPLLQKVLILVGIAITVLAIYYGNVAYQSALGRQALAKTGLTSLPLATAEEEARNQSKPVLVEVAAIWCPTCRTLDEYIFSDPRVQQIIRDRYLFCRMEYESPEGAAFLTEHQATGFPNLWVIDGNGKVIQHLSVVLTVEKFLEELP